jgi:hypothetical protein
MHSYRFRPLYLPLFAAMLVCASGCAGTNVLGTNPAVVSQNDMGGLTKHAQQKLYVTDYNGGVLVYSTGTSPQLLQTIEQGAPKPYGAWVDKSGVLYVVNLQNSTDASLSEYKPGASSPFLQITSGIPNFGVVAVDDNQNVYVSGLINSSETSGVEIFPPGQTVPSQTLVIPTQGVVSRSESLTFDPSDNLLVGVAALPKRYDAVLRLSESSGQFTSLGLRDVRGGLATADAAGDLFTAGPTKKVSVFAPGSIKPTRIISLPGFETIDALAAAPDGTLYVAASPYVYIYPPGMHKPSATLNTGVGIGGLAVTQ